MASFGLQLILNDGETCEVTKKPRRTIVQFPCNPNMEVDTSTFTPVKAYEGDNKMICNYFVEFPSSQLGCPLVDVNRENLLSKEEVTIQAGKTITVYSVL